MTVGFGIFLIAVGAIVRYALHFNLAGVEEGTIGLILIIAGLAVVVLGLISAPFRWAAWRRRSYVPRDRARTY
jgi:hypothetical protein